MSKLKWCLDTGFAGEGHRGEFEVEDDATIEEIEEEAREEAFNMIDWGYEVEVME